MFHDHRIKAITLFALIVLVLSVVAWRPDTTLASGGGTAYFTDGGYADSSTTYSYVVFGAPHNMCGTLVLDRINQYNQSTHETAANWICTDNYGNATRGPWGPPTSNELAENIHIEWANDTQTNYLTHVNCVNYFANYWCP